MGQAISWITENLASDPSQGEARGGAQSVSTMVQTLVPMVALSSIYLIIFLATRRPQKRFYAPRAYLGSLPEKERSPELPNGLFSWFYTFWTMPDVYALRHQGLDAYLFLRYLRICVAICFVSMCITWPILFPIHATGGNGKGGLEYISYSNINIKTNVDRLYAHAMLAWVVYGFIMYMITRECIFYINLRQAFLLSPQVSKRISSRTVLFTCVPEEYLDEGRIRHTFGPSVKNVWIVGSSRKLTKLVKKRDKILMKLEMAETEFIRAVNEQRLQAFKRPARENGGLSHKDLESCNLVDPNLRPKHRLHLFGKKVDTIDWCRSELKTLIPEVEAAQAKWQAGHFQKASSLFVEFHTQFDAQSAFESTSHHHALTMSPKVIGVRPKEIIWNNMTVPWWQLIIRQYAVYGTVGAMVIFWAIPVGLVGIVAQISILKQLPFLKWIDLIPDEIMGVIAGLLPSGALAIAMMVVPGLLGFCARVSGLLAQSQVELFVQNAFFLFQLVQVFLIRTITDTASAALLSIVQQPTRVFSILSEALPTSSNFYISYFIVEGLMIGMDVMTQVAGCVIFNIAYKIWSRNPREMYTRWTSLASISWGSTMPVYTGIVIISITYAVIAPFLLLWSTAGIWIFYQAYRYNILFVSDTEVDTRGLIYPRALKQLFSGIYLAEICLVGMFAVSQAPGPAALVIILLVFTVLYQITLNRALNPLLENLPRTLQADEALHQRQASQSNASTLVVGGSMDRRASSFADKKHLQKGNFFVRFLKPWIFADYWTLRNLVPQEEIIDMPDEPSDEIDPNPYWPPSVTSEPALLWIPEDPIGLSKTEIAETSKVTAITDKGCTLNEKNKLVWDTVGARPPIWESKVYY